MVVSKSGFETTITGRGWDGGLITNPMQKDQFNCTGLFVYILLVFK